MPRNHTPTRVTLLPQITDALDDLDADHGTLHCTSARCVHTAVAALRDVLVWHSADDDPVVRATAMRFGIEVPDGH